jgi:quinoprotein glucose dehydrogenase
MKKTAFCAALVASGLVVMGAIGCRSGSVNSASSAKTRQMSGGKAQNGQADVAQQNWPTYGGSPNQDHYSPLTQINRDNVSQLKEVWRYDTGEKDGLETSPLIIGGVLYGLTPTEQVFALNAATGKQIWKFNSGIVGKQADRGLAYWSDGDGNGRILVGIVNYVYALDAKTGKPIRSFGDHGRIDLRENLGRDPKLQTITLTSPGIVYKDLIIVGGEVP